MVFATRFQSGNTGVGRLHPGAGLLRKKRLTAISALLVIFFSSSSVSLSKDLSLHAVDVGQGDAMIVHQPGRCTMLIDAGLPVYAGRVAGILKSLQTDRIDMVIITHPHVDHFAGLDNIVNDFSAVRLFDNGGEGDPSPEFSTYRELKDQLIYRRLGSGDNMRCGDVDIEVLHPFSPPDPAANPNDTSLVLMLIIGDVRLLHMGDLAGRAAQQFVAALNDPQNALKADIIKIAHHGYEDAASAALLDLVEPEYAIISTSGSSCIGTACSPAESVLKRLEARTITYFRTDLDGDIEVTFKETGYRFNTSSMSGKQHPVSP